MANRKETIGRRYGVAVAKEYFGRYLEDDELERSGENARARLNSEIEADPEAATSEDASEMSDYIAALNVYDALQMATSAYTFQAVAYANRAARFLEEIAEAERSHALLCLRPLLIEEGDGLEEGEFEDLGEIDAAGDISGFLKAVRGNDEAGRLITNGHAVAHPKEGMLEGIMKADRGLTGEYRSLFELREPHARAEVNQARAIIEESARYIDRYIFTAHLLEAFLKIDGVSEVIAPSNMTETARSNALGAFNYAVGLIAPGYIVRFNRPNGEEEHPARAGVIYAEAMIERARGEWLYPIEWEDRTETLINAAHSAAKLMRHEDIARVSSLETFVKEQMAKRGLE